MFDLLSEAEDGFNKGSGTDQAVVDICKRRNAFKRDSPLVEDYSQRIVCSFVLHGSKSRMRVFDCRRPLAG